MLKDFYNQMYSQDDYFNSRRWINKIYVKSLIRKSDIPRASRLLDVGCGQGHFSYLFSKHGMEVLGVDLSEEGILYAQKHYEMEGPHFMVCDAFAIPVSTKFDCVFARSLSLYNTDNVEQIRRITRILMEHLRKDGIFVFCYHANFNKKKQVDSFRCHTLEEIRQYFSDYQNKEIFFSSKVDCLVFGKLAFNKIFSYINVFASRILGLGGEIVCFIKK
jgi:SAM-dependent methyltransferase